MLKKQKPAPKAEVQQTIVTRAGRNRLETVDNKPTLGRGSKDLADSIHLLDLAFNYIWRLR